LRSYYKYAKRMGYVKVNIMNKVISPKTVKNISVFVEERNILKLLDEVKFPDNYEGLRDRLIIEMLYLTGFRVSELINIKISDVDFSNNSIKVLGKRSKERIVPVSGRFMSMLKEYIVNNRNKTICESDYLFISNCGNKLNRSKVYLIVRHYLSIVTTIKKRSPHVLRHSFATHMLDNGADINAIKELLGHSSLAATQIYTHTSIEKIKDIYKRSHPWGGE